MIEPEQARAELLTEFSPLGFPSRGASPTAGLVYDRS